MEKDFKKRSLGVAYEVNPTCFSDDWIATGMLRNTGKIDRNAAKIQDLQAALKQMQEVNEWGGRFSLKPRVNSPDALTLGTMRGVASYTHRILIDSWDAVDLDEMVHRPSIDVPLNIKDTFVKLEDDFLNISNRIVWCNQLNDFLFEFEEQLEDCDAKYLSWFVSTLKDVFSYNYAELITEEQLSLLKEGIDTIYNKTNDCDKELFTSYHLKLAESGLSLLPTTQKVIDEYGE